MKLRHARVRSLPQEAGGCEDQEDQCPETRRVGLGVNVERQEEEGDPRLTTESWQQEAIARSTGSRGLVSVPASEESSTIDIKIQLSAYL